MVKDTKIESDIINPVIMPKLEQLTELNKFLTYFGYPYGITKEELNSIYDDLKTFLDIEFFKLGYIKFANIE